MRVLDLPQLRSGMMLGYDVHLDDFVVMTQYSILTDNNIKYLKDLFPDGKQVWVLDLVELKPIIMESDYLIRQYIDFVISTSKGIFNSVLENKRDANNLIQKVYGLLLNNKNLLFEAIVLRDNHCYTYDHSMNVAIYSLMIGLELGLTTKELNDLMLGCILHDYGKRLISSEILNKPDKLDEKEFKAIMQHPIYGVSLTSTVEGMNDNIVSIIEQHHEKLDGTGYPKGLRGSEICYLTRIVTVSDIYDATTSERSYHKKRSVAEGIKAVNEEVSLGKVGKNEFDALRNNLVLYPKNTIVVLNNNKSGLVLEDCGNSRPKVLCYDGTEYDLVRDKFLKIVEVI